MMQACERAGLKVELHAVNHWARAIETHAANFPWANHYCTGVEALDPCRTVPGGKVDLLWASPECTHHSTARGGRPKSDQSRASAWLILKWVQELYVRRIVVENVSEFLQWGPLDARGQAIASRKGETYAAWVNALRSLGYRVEWRILNAADYGAPTTRRRLFVQAVRGAARLVWPEPSHAEDQTTLFADARRPWRAAAEVIDWSVLGQRLSERSRPLAEATLRRIETGIRRYWGAWAEPFLIVLRGTGSSRRLELPLPALTAGGEHLGLCTPFVTRYNGGAGGCLRVHSLDEPLRTVDCSNRYGLVEPFITGIDNQSTPDGNRSVGEPLSTVVTKARHCLVEPFVVQSEHDNRVHSLARPMPTVTCSSRGFGLVEPFVLGQQSGAAPRRTREPLPTVATDGAISVVSPFLAILRGQSEVRIADRPSPTISCSGAHLGLVVPYYGNDEAGEIGRPLRTVTCKDRFGLLEGETVKLDIRFRMLLPHELSGAQGFPREYAFSGTREEQVRQIGNAVCPPVAAALAYSALTEAES